MPVSGLLYELGASSRVRRRSAAHWSEVDVID